MQLKDPDKEAWEMRWSINARLQGMLTLTWTTTLISLEVAASPRGHCSCSSPKNQTPFHSVRHGSLKSPKFSKHLPCPKPKWYPSCSTSGRSCWRPPPRELPGDAVKFFPTAWSYMSPVFPCFPSQATIVIWSTPWIEARVCLITSERQGLYKFWVCDDNLCDIDAIGLRPAAQLGESWLWGPPKRVAIWVLKSMPRYPGRVQRRPNVAQDVVAPYGQPELSLHISMDWLTKWTSTQKLILYFGKKWPSQSPDTPVSRLPSPTPEGKIWKNRDKPAQLLPQTNTVSWDVHEMCGWIDLTWQN